MSRTSRVGSLEVEQDLAFQSWQWRASQALWFLLLAVILAAALGVFGGGPLSHAEAGSVTGQLWAEYERVVRFGASVRLIVHARPQPDADIRFTLGHSLVRAFRIERITPSPSSTALADNGVEYRFPAEGTGTGMVIFELQPEVRWRVDGRIASPDDTLQLQLFVLP